MTNAQLAKNARINLLAAKIDRLQRRMKDYERADLPPPGRLETELEDLQAEVRRRARETG